MTDAVLLPCQFCGNDKNIAMANERHDHSGGYFIACPKRDASTAVPYHHTRVIARAVIAEYELANGIGNGEQA